MLIHFEGEYIFGWSLHAENLFDWIEGTYILTVLVFAFAEAGGHFSSPWTITGSIPEF